MGTLGTNWPKIYDFVEIKLIKILLLQEREGDSFTFLEPTSIRHRIQNSSQLIPSRNKPPLPPLPTVGYLPYDNQAAWTCLDSCLPIHQESEARPMDIPLPIANGKIASSIQKAQGCGTLGLPIPACTSAMPAITIQFTGCAVLHSARGSRSILSAVDGSRPLGINRRR